MASVSVNSISKYYQQTAALDQVSIEFQEGEFFALLGPSGSGKTTLLRSIAGFVTPDNGHILFNDKPVENIPVHKRDIGMVFQNYALFPHLTVFDNIAFGLAVRGSSRNEQKQKVGKMLELVRLSGFEQRKPRQLSGGQQQRVALARALITQPQVLLLDEPLGALDKRLRQQMQIELKQIQREVGLTTIFVTHDQEEALTLSDRIAIINHGQLVQIGQPDEVYERPDNIFAANFLGDANFFEGEVINPHQILVNDQLQLTTTDTLSTTDSPTTLAVRPEKIQLLQADSTIPTELTNQLTGTIEQMIYSGNSHTYIVDCNGIKLNVFAQNQKNQNIKENQPVVLAWTAENCIQVQQD